MAAALAIGEVTEPHARSLARCLTPRTLEAFARDEAMLTDSACELGADVFDAVVSRWLAVNDQDGPEPGGAPSELHASRTFGSRVRIDGELDADEEADAAAAAPRGGRPRRRQLIAVVDIDPRQDELPATGTLDDGSILPRSTIERWLCDCAIGRVLLRGRSLPLDLGQVTYTPSPAQRRALVARDRGCIVDGCDRRPRWCDAHHVVPFPEGPTDLRNLTNP